MHVVSPPQQRTMASTAAVAAAASAAASASPSLPVPWHSGSLRQATARRVRVRLAELAWQPDGRGRGAEEQRGRARAPRRLAACRRRQAAAATLQGGGGPGACLMPTCGSVPAGAGGGRAGAGLCSRAEPLPAGRPWGEGRAALAATAACGRLARATWRLAHRRGRVQLAGVVGGPGIAGAPALASQRSQYAGACVSAGDGALGSQGVHGFCPLDTGSEGPSRAAIGPPSCSAVLPIYMARTATAPLPSLVQTH